MPTTPILGIDQVAANQDQKEVTINDAITALEAAGNATLNVSFASAASVTLSVPQFTRNYVFRAIGATAAATLKVPAQINGVNSSRLFAVTNRSGQAVSVVSTTIGGSGVLVPDGHSRLLSIDGSNNVIIAAEPGTAINFVDLLDVPHTYAGQSGLFLRAKADGTGLEFAAPPLTLNDLTDVDTTGVMDGQVLAYDTATGHWKPHTPTSVTTFLGLTDTPSAYTGQANKMVRVNGGANALEFVDPTTGNVPAGGTTGQVLTKRSNTNGDCDWEAATGGSALPAGGADGQFLGHVAGSPAWANIPTELPAGGTNGQVLTLVAGAPTWQTPTNKVRVGAFVTTAPAASEVIALFAADSAYSYSANFAGSVAIVGTNPAAIFVFTVKRTRAGAATAIGTISISTAGVVTFATTGGTAQAVLAGDLISVVAQAGTDASIANVAMTLIGQ